MVMMAEPFFREHHRISQDLRSQVLARALLDDAVLVGALTRHFRTAKIRREVAAAVRGSPALQHYQSPVFHNVQAFKQSLATPRRRRDDYSPAHSVVQA